LGTRCNKAVPRFRGDKLFEFVAKLGPEDDGERNNVDEKILA
jgi:hypothetical protein